MPTNNADNYGYPVGVSNGGFGSGSYNVNGPLCAGTTTTGACQSVPVPLVSGAVLTSRGAGMLPNFRQSNLIFLNQQTASSSASLAFTSTYITSTYSTYLLVFSSLVTATAGKFVGLQISTNNGSGYVTSGYQAAISVFFNSTTIGNTNESAECILSQALNTSGIGISGCVWLYNLQNGGNFQLGGLTYQLNSSSVYSQTMCTGYNATASVNNIKLFGSAATNLASGTVSLFGLNGS